MKKVVIITGGYSSEHNISLKSARTVEIELKNLGYSVSILKIEKSGFDFRSIKTAMFDYAFIALHEEFKLRLISAAVMWNGNLRYRPRFKGVLDILENIFIT